MKCENLFCIYNEEDKCILDTIELDIQGKCLYCIYVDIEEGYLNFKKKKQLESE